MKYISIGTFRINQFRQLNLQLQRREDECKCLGGSLIFDIYSHGSLVDSGMDPAKSTINVRGRGKTLFSPLLFSFLHSRPQRSASFCNF